MVCQARNGFFRYSALTWCNFGGIQRVVDGQRTEKVAQSPEKNHAIQTTPALPCRNHRERGLENDLRATYFLRCGVCLREFGSRSPILYTSVKEELGAGHMSLAEGNVVSYIAGKGAWGKRSRLPAMAKSIR